jgi:hypothetical protein
MYSLRLSAPLSTSIFCNISSSRRIVSVFVLYSPCILCGSLLVFYLEYAPIKLSKISMQKRSYNFVFINDYNNYNYHIIHTHKYICPNSIIWIGCKINDFIKNRQMVL